MTKQKYTIKKDLKKKTHMYDGALFYYFQIECDGFDEVRSVYEKRLAEMQESYERYIESLKKDKSVLFAIACVLTAFLVLFLVMDLTLGSVGWIRY